jgi:asparagine synthase (glutamine-hydrolysing)
VPFGAFLSGGVDSSLIAALMAQESSKPVEAFSIGYGREGALMNELPYARAVASRWAMNHHELILDSEDLLRDIDRVAWHLDEPCGDPAAFLTLALSRFARERVTVALSGLGADELFAGYRRYLSLVWRERWLTLPAALRDGVVRPLLARLPESRTGRLSNYVRMARKFTESVDADARTAWARTVSYLPDYAGPIFEGELAGATRESFACAAFEQTWARTAGFPTAMDRGMYMDLRMYMADQLLLLQDKMSMAVSLEARVPFLDYRLVEMAASVPARAKLERGTLKAPLKRLAERYVPRECVWREKKGFVAPVEAWLRGPLREQVRDALAPRRVRERGLFQPPFVEWMLHAFYEEQRDLSLQLYQAFLLEKWFALFVDPAVPEPPAAPPRG